MRTRSKASSEEIIRAIEKKEKRNWNDDDTRDSIKRCKTQLCAEVAKSLPAPAKSPFKRSSTSENGDDEAFTMTLGKFVGALRQQASAGRSSRISVSLKKTITKKHGTKVQSCDYTSTLDEHHCRGNEKSTEGGATEQCSSTLLLRTGVNRDNITPIQEGSVEQCSSAFERNVHTPGASTHYGEDGLQIVDTPLSPQEVAGIHCQLQEDGHHNIADTTLAKGNTEKCLHRKKKGASIQNGSHATLLGKKLQKQPLSRRRSGKSKCRPGNMKKFKASMKKSIGTTPTEVLQQLNSCYSHKRINAAKSRWKSLAQSILSTKISPETRGSRNYETLSLPKKQRKASAAMSASGVDQRSVTGRMQQKVHKQQLSLLNRMKTWLTEAKFTQGEKEKNSDDVGEEFIMTEDERCAFAQTMVQSCQKNPNMRTIFLESVRMLTLSGLMQAAASNLVQQGPCEEAESVMNAWADYKEQREITKTLPMNLLSAVNQLHEKRGDLSNKLSAPNVVGICTLSQIDEKTWKFQLPGLPL